MKKNKILFIFKRYKYNDNKVLAFKNLTFLSIISSIVITSLKFIVENSNEENFDVNFSKNTRKRSTSILKTLKKKMI